MIRVSIPQGDDGRVFCSVIAFHNDAVARLLQLKAGAPVALAGGTSAGDPFGDLPGAGDVDWLAA